MVAGLLVGAYFLGSARIYDARVDLLRAVVDSSRAIAAAYEKDEKSGRLTRLEAQNAAAAAIGAIRYAGTEYVWINDLHPRMVMHPIRPELNGTDLTQNRDPNGKQLFVAFADTARTAGAGIVDYLWPRQGSEAPVPKLSYVELFAPWGWVVGTGVYADDLVLARRELAEVLAAVGLFAVVLVGAVIWLLGRGVTRPIRALTAVTARLAAGDLAVDVVGVGRADELGELARAMEVLKAGSIERLRLERAAEDERGATERRQIAMDRNTESFGETVSDVLGRLASAAVDMRGTASRMTDGTDRTRTSANAVAEGSADASRDLATVAAATVELSASVDEIARQVGRSTDATQDAVRRAAETQSAFVKLSDLAQRIGEVVDLISGIAGQTNLLALNATIEAARAGDAGKGFAVVASEVKALAAQTARATAEIVQNVGAIRDETANTASAIRDVGTAIDRLDTVATAIAAAIEQQGATTREIASRVQTVAATGERTASAMTDVASVADQTGTMSHTVLQASDEIGRVAGTLRVEVEAFLAAMRANDVHRRRHQRLAADDTRATLIVPGGKQVPVGIKDISQGGAALRSSWHGEPGLQVELLLPGSALPVPVGLVRQGDGVVAVRFAEDPSSLAAVDRVMQALSDPGIQRAA